MAKRKPGAHVADLLYQALETEIGGASVYRAALQCVQDDELSEEWRDGRAMLVVGHGG